jgi:adenylylsulfate kinase
MTKIKATNITWHESHVARKDREVLLNQKGFTIWFTGLPSSGKSTTAFTLEHELTKRGHLAYVLDGDNIRHGLNKNLGFTMEDREENIRRIGEVAKLFADSGVITMTSFISPYRKDRDLVRQIHENAGLDFIEIFVDTSIDMCEKRDPKGLFSKARKGEIKGFTGVDDPYEAPLNAEMVLDTTKKPPQDVVVDIIKFLIKRRLLPTEKK